MTYRHLDPHRPHIDGASIFCPSCGQSYDTIADNFLRLPPRHYPQPTRVTDGDGGHLVVVGTEAAAGNRGRLCPTDNYMLVKLLFRAQVAAEQQREQAA